MAAKASEMLDFRRSPEPFHGRRRANPIQIETIPRRQITVRFQETAIGGITRRYVATQ
jgi:hypothetical protein